MSSSAARSSSIRPLIAAATLLPAPPSWLDELEQTIGPAPDASARARALQSASGGDSDAERSVALTFAADALASLTLENTLEPDAVAELGANVYDVLGGPARTVSVELLLRALASPKLLGLPPLLAIELQLRLLAGLGQLDGVSLWRVDHDRQVGCVVQIGAAPSAEDAREVLDGGAAGGSIQSGTLHCVPVMRWQQTYGALIAESRPNDPERIATLLTEAATMLGPVLERELLLERSADRERTLVEAAEKRLLRLGFDLHDGPLQDVVALASDVRLARDEVEQRLPRRVRGLVAGRLDDLHGQVVEIDSALRELARSLEPASVLERPLADIVRNEVDRFENRSGMRVSLEIGGDLSNLTASQRIVLFRVVQEGLSNVREHSEASEVRIRVDGTRSTIEAEVTDDGRGFEVAPTLVLAAKRERMGLVGIGERVRLLGGSFDIQSHVGGPTSLRLVLPRWRPTATAGASA